MASVNATLANQSLRQPEACNADAVGMISLHGEFEAHLPDGLGFGELAKFSQGPGGERGDEGKRQSAEAEQRPSRVVVECGDTLAQMICGSDMVTEKQQCLTDPVMRQAAQLPAVEFLGCREPTHAGLDGEVMLALDPVVAALIESGERQPLAIADAFRQCSRFF